MDPPHQTHLLYAIRAYGAARSAIGPLETDLKEFLSSTVEIFRSAQPVRNGFLFLLAGSKRRQEALSASKALAEALRIAEAKALHARLDLAHTQASSSKLSKRDIWRDFRDHIAS